MECSSGGKFATHSTLKLPLRRPDCRSLRRVTPVLCCSPANGRERRSNGHPVPELLAALEKTHVEVRDAHRTFAGNSNGLIEVKVNFRESRTTSIPVRRPKGRRWVS